MQLQYYDTTTALGTWNKKLWEAFSPKELSDTPLKERNQKHVFHLCDFTSVYKLQGFF